MSIFAAALARRGGTSFEWANCSRAPDRLDPVALRLLEGENEEHREPQVDPRDLTAPPPYDAQLSHLVVPETISPGERSQLREYFRLPLLIQRLLSRGRPESERPRLLLTNVDALPPSVAADGLARTEVQALLRREGVLLVVTYRGIPPDPLRHAFERVYRTEGDETAPWADAIVTVEKGGKGETMPSPASLRELLPWLGLAGGPSDGPVAGSGPHHR